MIGTYLGYRVGVLKGKVDKIMPLLEALEDLREDVEHDREFEKTKAEGEKRSALEIVEDLAGREPR